MPKFIFTNNASGTLLSSITSTVATITLQAGQGAKFPAPSSADGTVFQCAIIDVSGSAEILQCTARSGDVLTVLRGQEGTAARSWTAGSRVEHRLTATQLQANLQKAGGVMSGDIDMAGNAIRNPVFPDGLGSDKLTAHEIHHEVDASNNWGITLHTNRKPDMNGDPFLLKSDLMGLVFMWSGSESSLNKSVWKLCDGTNGTPDLRNRFILGHGNLFSAGQKYPTTVNALTQPTSEDGFHDHQGYTANHTLTLSQIPSHSHNVPSGGNAPNQNGGYASFGDTKNLAPQTTSSTGGGAPHQHAIPMGGKHTHTIQPPAFYVLCYVMLR